MTAVSRASSTRVSAAAPWNSRGKRARRPAADGAPTPSAATSGRLSALADPRARLADGPVSPRGARPASLLLGSPAHRWRRPRALGPPPRRRSQPVCDKRPERPRALIGCAHTPVPIAHIGHWAWIELLVFAPAFAVLPLAACAHAAHRHTPNRKIETLRPASIVLASRRSNDGHRTHARPRGSRGTHARPDLLPRLRIDAERGLGRCVVTPLTGRLLA